MTPHDGVPALRLPDQEPVEPNPGNEKRGCVYERCPRRAPVRTMTCRPSLRCVLVRGRRPRQGNSRVGVRSAQAVTATVKGGKSRPPTRQIHTEVIVCERSRMQAIRSGLVHEVAGRERVTRA